MLLDELKPYGPSIWLKVSDFIIMIRWLANCLASDRILASILALKLHLHLFQRSSISISIYIQFLLYFTPLSLSIPHQCLANIIPNCIIHILTHHIDHISSFSPTLIAEKPTTTLKHLYRRKLSYQYRLEIV